MKIVTYRPIEHGHETAVFVNGEQVGRVRKRHESYTGLKRGGWYVYYDFYAGDSREKLTSGTTRKGAVAEALVALDLHEAANEVDPDTAWFYMNKEV